MEERQAGLELYSDQELEAVGMHIARHFGAFRQVFREEDTQDLRVDICLIPPSEQRFYYTLVTVGMGAHRMDIPQELQDKGLERAELLLTLPPNWDLESDEECWYWPLRWMKILARLPKAEATWLGWGHTVPAGEPFAENTALSSILLELPYTFGEESMACPLPTGGEVRFYQMIPLYPEELAYKVAHGTDALAQRFDHSFSDVIDPARKNYCGGYAPPAPKRFARDLTHPERLIDSSEGCIATDRILVEGARVGLMYREAPSRSFADSGWRFLAGDETQEYIENPDNAGIYPLNTLCNCDREILPFLASGEGSAFRRDENGVFRPVQQEPAR